MSTFNFIHPLSNEVFYFNATNHTINILWTGGPTPPNSSNVALSLVDLGTTKNPDPYGQVLFPITGAISVVSSGVGMCAWQVPLDYAFNPEHYYVVYIQNAQGEVTNWVYSAPFTLISGATVAAPGPGLGSNSNYILYSGCGPVMDLAITIDITSDIVCQSASGSTTGFSFQLDAYSPKNMTCALQQYIIGVAGKEIFAGIDNWPIDGNNLINDWFNLAPTANNTLAAGYKLKIILQNDAGGNITGVVFIVIDNNGNTLADIPTTLTSLPLATASPSPGPVTSTDLAPISAFELNLVGPINGESAVLSSGAGTILYSASSILTVLNQEPSCTETGSITQETANSFYGFLPAAPGNGLIQSFLSYPSNVMPMIRKPTIPRRWPLVANFRR